jgi:hypothetical protein
MADIDTITGFKIMIIVMLFYSFSITLLVNSLPDTALNPASIFQDVDDRFNIESIGSEIQGGLESQTNIPVYDLGALVFYSGNILIDLLLNFLFAIPQMIGFLFAGILILISLPTTISHLIQIFASVAVTAWYVISLVQLLTNVRTGRMV